MTEHYGEAFTEGGFAHHEWGWHCLTCGWETTGFEDIDAAEAAGDQHIHEATP